MTFNSHALAILEAQWRIFRNHFRRTPTGMALTALVAVCWYGMWGFLALGAIPMFAGLHKRDLADVFPLSLMGVFFFWQVFPILLVSSGISLDLRKLQPYPIPLGQLYWLEVLLRVTAAFEMVLLLSGISIGLWQNPSVPAWGPIWLVPFVALNLFFSTGLRDLLARIFARKRYRELISLLVLVIIALPQALLSFGMSHQSLAWTERLVSPIWPWTAAATLARGHFSLLAFACLLVWMLLGFAFSRWQFRRTFDFDADQTGVREHAPRRFGFAESLYTLPSRVLPDPLAAVVEKELRFLSRAPRFRVLFMMGFSFGLLVFMPTFLRSRTHEGFFAANFLTMVGAYALLLLGEVLFWNNLGFDRSAVQTYFVVPVRFRTVLIGKNIAAVCFALLEVLVLALVCTVFRLAITAEKVFEALCVVVVLTVYLTAIGNLSSVRGARPINPSQAMRGRVAGQAQMVMLLLYPAALLPAALAFGARYAFDSSAAFYLVLLLDLLVGAVVYYIALESAEATALRRQEDLVSELSKGEGLVSA